MIEQRLDRLGWRKNATPGITATLEIKTGQKTLLEYLLRPLQSMTQALCERLTLASVQPTSLECAETLINHPMAAMMQFQKGKGFMPAPPVENHHGAKP